MNDDINSTSDLDTPDDVRSDRDKDSTTGTRQRSEFGDVGNDDEQDDVEDDQTTRSDIGAGE